MKRNNILKTTHVSEEGDPEIECIGKESISDKITEIFYLYLPEIFLSFFGLIILKKLLQETSMFSTMFLMIFLILIISFYCIYKADYLDILRRDTVFSAIQDFDFVYLSIKNDEIVEIFCMDEDKFDTNPTDEIDAAFRIERLK